MIQVAICSPSVMPDLPVKETPPQLLFLNVVFLVWLRMSATKRSLFYLALLSYTLRTTMTSSFNALSNE
ncbi:hypothetical protein Poly59_59450 [Rubripirellula reticaptiva]|uniref:Uncharacterized protein n=1 Tax=Rubripirellula reticaptiva TaxID=2528013 RepID=A0A5C6EGX8_9BACT|nr:hypothetical protein Poly59_59450 [Rubripirellula reticaptiva]